MKKAILILSVILLLSLSIYTVSNYNKSNTKVIQNSTNKNVNEQLTASIKLKAADFKLKNLNGKEVSLSDFRGKKVFINFWATWCTYCKYEMPDIEKLYQETKNSDLVILAINLGEDQKTVKFFMDDNKYSFNVLLDSNQDVAIKYNIVAIPTSFFIDKNGNIVSKKIGAMTLKEMKSHINSLK